MDNSYLDSMKKEGVFVFDKILDDKKIQLLVSEIKKISKIVISKVNTMERPLKTYSDIAERHFGRLDYRCGFTADIFKQAAEPIIKLVKTLSPQVDFKHYWGVVTSLSHAEATDMHRDVYPILNDVIDQNLCSHDISLPPYYFTVLIPLVKITKEMGPTEFIRGSNNRQVVDISKETIYAPLLSPGDIVVFDGRTLHRGLPNHTNKERLVAYITFIAKWYYDQTFVENNYLFPELAI
jgi:ectoine hydroxylase-related dioxygenase (phytanoyl-CoA dioxygenase family)